MSLNAGLNNLYPTQIQLEKIPVKQEYINSALQQEVCPELRKMVVEGWDKYIQSILPGKKLSDWKFESQEWINIYRSEEMEYHTHSGSQLSTVVYLENDGEGGEITFYDPRGFAARGYDLSFRPLFNPTDYMPDTGDILTFPSYMYHSVRPAKGLRISVVFDLFLYNKS
jgi:hypothetical protein